ncbi:helix-turn-helix transcriptional regulator [Paenibacillus chitinolyticus]|uniref:helix-turn-helix transcriptional regulator n=1 Tax=Paenibacillus chitinolyticus TaxID=79263 RepID=UPI00366BA5F8
MVLHRSLSDQSRFSSVFRSLKLGKLLPEAGIRKSFGHSALVVFQLLFSFVFESKNWFQTIVAIEKGNYSPSLELAFRIARVFGKSIEEVFQYDDKQKGGSLC